MTDNATPAKVRLNDELGAHPERAGFELHAQGLGCSVDHAPRAGRKGGYWSSHTHMMWETWQAARAAPAWQPIETAPRDGAEVWAFNGKQARMKWIEGGYFALWVWADELLADADPNPEQPTHWQPLPAAPA